MKLKLNYVWLDGTLPEPKLRSKIKIEYIRLPQLLTEYPIWSFDGSSTNQAQGSSSDCYLKPVKLYYPEKITEYCTIYVLCEVLDKDNKPHSTNDRAVLGKEDDDFWVGFEQEYFIRSGHNKLILGFDKGSYVEPQGIYYCGVGGQIVGRNVSNIHLDKCLEYGLDIQGTNAEVAIGQWEYQIFSRGKVAAADDLTISRYFLYEIAEELGYDIELHPKPLIGEWNGSGLHTNFSNEKMRKEGGEDYFKAIFNIFEARADKHIQVYGSNNHLRLTGKFETQAIDKFSWGISDRGASIRVPKKVAETWTGYLEDRRPAANANPYKVIYIIYESLKLTETLERTLHNMYDDVSINVDEIKKNPAFNRGILSNEELLKEYMTDETDEINKDIKM